MAAQGRGCAVAVALLIALLVSGSQAVQHTVGGSEGWNLQVNYDTWVAQNKFQVGDTLLFTYNAEAHNVLQVSAADYQSCNLAKPIKTWDDGNTVVTLSDATTYSYVCGIPTHCTVGMKVEVSVLASAAAPTASNATSPVATSPVSPPPATPPAVAPASPPPATTPPVVSLSPAVSPPPATPPAVAPASPPPATTPPVVSPSPSVSSPPPAAVPSPSPSSASASSPTASPSSPPPTPSSSPAPSSSATPTPTPTTSSLSPSSPLPSILTPPPSTEPATAPSASDASTCFLAQALTTITSAALVGALLL